MSNRLINRPICRKHRKSRTVSNTIPTDFSRSVSVPSDKIWKSTSPVVTTPITPDLELVE